MNPATPGRVRGPTTGHRRLACLGGFVNKRGSVLSVSVSVCAAAVLVAGATAPASASAHSTGRTSQLGVAECARDINERGTVVLDTALYRNGHVEPLPGGLQTGALVNNLGHVVGTVDGSTTAIWNGTQTSVIAPVSPEHQYAAVSALNERGDVAGTSGVFGGPTSAFVRTRDGSVRVLSEPGVVAGANGLNDRGQVVGFVTENDVQVAVRWNKDGSMTRLPALVAGANALAVDINDNGVMVGYSYEGAGTGVMHAVRWSRTGAIENLDPAGTSVAGAVDVNRYGRVVGSLALQGGGQQGFVRDANGPTRVVPLSQPGTIELFSAVNDYGWAVGCSYRDAETSAFLWRP